MRYHRILALILISGIFQIFNNCQRSAQNKPMPLHGFDSCLENVDKLVRTSSFKNPFQKNYNIIVDEYDDELIRIRITNVNEEKREVTSGWLVLDMINEELRNESIDPEEPILHKFDRQLLLSLKNKKCK